MFRMNCHKFQVTGNKTKRVGQYLNPQPTQMCAHMYPVIKQHLQFLIQDIIQRIEGQKKMRQRTQQQLRDIKHAIKRRNTATGPMQMNGRWRAVWNEPKNKNKREIAKYQTYSSLHLWDVCQWYWWWTWWRWRWWWWWLCWPRITKICVCPYH